MTQLGLVCGGTGITPMLQILRDILKASERRVSRAGLYVFGVLACFVAGLYFLCWLSFLWVLASDPAGYPQGKTARVSLACMFCVCLLSLRGCELAGWLWGVWDGRAPRPYHYLLAYAQTPPPKNINTDKTGPQSLTHNP